VDVSDLEPGQMKAVQHHDLSILVCNAGGEIHAVENQCSHAAVPLLDGYLDGCELECSFHGAVFDVRDGSVIALPAKEPLRSFPVEPAPAGDRVYVRV
jgi:3-phenylpropionate/trans-cinnamate dioxygenase ferredoxin subunit